MLLPVVQILTRAARVAVRQTDSDAVRGPTAPRVATGRAAEAGVSEGHPHQPQPLSVHAAAHRHRPGLHHRRRHLRATGRGRQRLRRYSTVQYR